MIFPTTDKMYSLCADTVTIYHPIRQREPRGDITGVQTIICGTAFFENKKNLTIDKLGATEGNSFLLIVPGDHQMVYPGDKVLYGSGPLLTTAEDWRNLRSDTQPGLVIVKTVDVKRWAGRIVHTEAGG